MGNIVILDENTSNQIAAGEVVERPASVVKELLENSIDAGSTNISIEINNGGVSLIKVVDNGSGIDEDDVEIAFERHATSKIRNSNDLESIYTLGFRGEALASIASVSAVELTTRVKEKQYGKYIKIQGGVVKEVSQTGCPVGTSFIVRDLFYNTPARFKFLKKDTTEAGYISDIVNRIALGNKQISIRLINNRNTVIHTPGNNDLLSTIFSLYGKDVAKEVLEVNYQDEKVEINGYAGKPEIARSNRNYQSIYINGRYVKNKIISAAIDEAYKTYLLKNKFAFIVLSIRINPLLVDVNVHPTKMEVRFSEEQAIFRAVYHAVNNALLSKSLIRNVEFPDKSKNYFKFEEGKRPANDYVQEGMKTKIRPSSESLNEDLNKNDHINNTVKYGEKKARPVDLQRNVSEKDSPDNSEIDLVRPTVNKKLEEGTLYTDIQGQNVSRESIDNNSNFLRVDTNISVSRTDKKEEELKQEFRNDADEEVEENNKNNENVEYKTSAGDKQDDMRINNREQDENLLIDAKIIGQAFSTYILLQNGDKLILIDQHAAHERIMFENLKKKYKSSENLAQYLLSSIVIELTNQEVKIVDENRDKLNKLGFVFESFGNNSIILRSVPVLADNAGIKETFLEILDFLMSKQNKDDSFLQEEALYRLACKSAVKANKRLSDKEIISMIKELSAIENPYTCPHGRPTIIKITKYEFEKMFKRIV